jgi:putative oxidoreductase
LLLIGLYTRLALIPLVICLFVIVFVVHGEDPLGDKEHAILYLAPYLTLMLTGPGKYSLDSWLRKV